MVKASGGPLRNIPEKARVLVLYRPGARAGDAPDHARAGNLRHIAQVPRPARRSYTSWYPSHEDGSRPIQNPR